VAFIVTFLLIRYFAFVRYFRNKWHSRIELQAYFPQPVLQNVNFKFNSPAMFPFFVFHKSGLIKSCPLKIYQNTKLHGTTLTGRCFNPPQKS
jgi:hypothetical protein